MFNFTSKPDFPAELDRVYKITDGVIRSMIIAKSEEKQELIGYVEQGDFNGKAGG